VSTGPKPRKKATYVAPNSDKEWLLNVQRKLYTQSWEKPDYVFRKLWGFITDPRNLRCSLARVARNKGSRTAGVDGVTVRIVLKPENPGIFAPGVLTMQLGRERPPSFVETPMESPVHSERCTPGSEEGAPETAR
jgi:hypothetical protein